MVHACTYSVASDIFANDMISPCSNFNLFILEGIRFYQAAVIIVLYQDAAYLVYCTCNIVVPDDGHFGLKNSALVPYIELT